MTLRKAYAVKLGSTVLSGLQNIDTQTNPEVDSEVSLGSVFPQFVCITGQKPKMMFMSRSVAACLGLVGLTGATIDGSTNLIGYSATLDGIGNPASGSVHRTYTANRGLLVPRRLSCQHRQNAQLDLEAILYSSDGAAYPLAIADNVALPTISAAIAQHTLGPVTLGISGTTVVIPDLQNISIDFGNGAQTTGASSNLYDSYMENPQVKPVINLTGIDALVFGGSSKVPPAGQQITHAGTTIYFRKRSTTGVGFVADGTAEHIKITANGVAVVTEHKGSGNGRSEVSIQLTTSWDGTNAPLVIDTASAIS